MITFELKLNPEVSELDVMFDILVAAQREVYSGDDVITNWSIFLVDSLTGERVGGASGYAVFDWAYIQFLAVPPRLRGQGLGRDLMARVEAFARERGLLGIFLDTFEFQSRSFYEKLGYSVFGNIGDHPRGFHRYFLSKRLDGIPAQSSSEP